MVTALTVFFLLYREIGPKKVSRIPAAARTRVTQDA